MLLTLEIVATVSKNKVLYVNIFMESCGFAGKLFRYSNTIETSYVDLYLGSGGLNLNTALTALHTTLCWPGGVSIETNVIFRDGAPSQVHTGIA